jgi:hypothetical protein
MKTSMSTLALLVSLTTLWPLAARADGLALEIGFVWVAPEEPSFRAVDDRDEVLASVGVGGAWTVARAGDFRFDALASWGVTSQGAAIGENLETALLEHAFVVGGQLRWARFFFVQPFVSLRAGPALGWYEVQGTGRIEAFDVAWRLEPAMGVEGFLPFSALSRPLPHLTSRSETGSGWAGAGIGLGLSVGYRAQTAYTFDGEPPVPEDDDEAADALPRSGPHLGRLTLSGMRMGIDITLRF